MGVEKATREPKQSTENTSTPRGKPTIINTRQDLSQVTANGQLSP